MPHVWLRADGIAEEIMDIVYAAEKSSIAGLLGNHIKQSVAPQEIEVTENPDETGSFLIDWRLRRYVLSPAGAIESDMPISEPRK